MKLGLVLSALALAMIGVGCSGSVISHASIPEVKPIVLAALPSGLKTTPPGKRLLMMTNPAFVDLNERFFNGVGPSDLLTTLLPNIDAITTALNSPTLSGDCLSQIPVAYQITPFGQTINMVAQCYFVGTPSYDGDPALTQFGTDQNGVINIYSANGAEWGAYQLTPIGGTTTYRVEAWIGLGYANASSGCGAVPASTNQQAYAAQWDTCSYGVMHLKANPETKVMELAVAGLGFGYCGVQLTSDGSNIKVSGSSDQGTTCNSLLTGCFTSDAITLGTCTASTLDFTLDAMGRGPDPVQFSLTACNAPAFDQSHVDITPQQCTGTTWAISNYPSSNANIVLDGTDTDALRFGPTTPTAGVGLLASH